MNGVSGFLVPVVTPSVQSNSSNPNHNHNNNNSSMENNTNNGNNNNTVHNNNSNNPLCLYMKDHGKSLCERLQMLKTQQELIDLDVVCEEQHWQVHKVIMAAASQFFKTHLCKAKVMVPVIINLEDFGLHLSPEAVGFLVEFIYKGEVVIPSGKLQQVCQAAHALGINGLTDFLPESANPNGNKEDDVLVVNEEEEETSESIPVVTLDDQTSQSGGGEEVMSSQEVHHVVVSIPSQYPSANLSFVESIQNMPNNFMAKNNHQDPMNNLGHNNEHDNSFSSSQYVQTVYPSYDNANLNSNNHFNNESAINQSPVVLASYPYQNHSSDFSHHHQQDLSNQQCTSSQAMSHFAPFSHYQHQSPGKFQSDNSTTAMSNELSRNNPVLSQSDASAAKLVTNHQSPGKLRVISQGLTEQTNIHIDPKIQQSYDNTANKSTPTAGNDSSSQTITDSLGWENSESADNNDIPWNISDSETNDFSEDGTGGLRWKNHKETPELVSPTPEPEKEEAEEEESMFAIRSGVPLALQRKRNTDSTYNSVNSLKKSKNNNLGSKNSKKCDLGVRKDLTLATATSATQDNVFQPDDSSKDSSVRDFPVVQLDDQDAEGELVINVGPPSKTSLEEIGNNANGDIQTQVQMDTPSTAGNTGSKDYQCVECTMEFFKEHELRQHVRHAHQIVDILFCPVCKIGDLKGKEALKIHLFKKHGMGEMFRCEECNYESTLKNNYLKHVSENHQQNRGIMKCTKCDKPFRSKLGLKLHLKKHSNTQPFKCNMCEFATALKFNLIKHMATKHKKDLEGKDLDESFRCDVCDFQCVAEYQMKDHKLRKHTSKENMKYKCTYCDYATIDRPSLAKHIRSHTNERPFMCDTCGFSTHTMSSMARHKRTHSNNKPFQCEICEMCYADKKRLRDHMMKHDGKFPFKCNFCNYQCRRKDNLKCHVKRLHLSPKKGLVLNDKKPDDETSSAQAGAVTELNGDETEKKVVPIVQGKKEEDEVHDVDVNSSDESHIVGHINLDGSIRPVSSVTPCAKVSNHGDRSPPILSLSTTISSHESSLREQNLDEENDPKEV